jgi:hypothetical protein
MVSSNRHQAEERNQRTEKEHDLDENEELKYSGVHRQGERKSKNLDLAKQEQGPQLYQRKKKGTAPQGKFKCFNKTINESGFKDMLQDFLDTSKIPKTVF